MNNEIITMLSGEIAKELYAVNFYSAVGAGFEYQNWTGFAKWAFGESNEEKTHADKIRDYILDRNGCPLFASVPAAPNYEDTPPLQMFREVLKTEMGVTGNLRAIYGRARELGDYETETFLDWFLKEQVEAERLLTEIIGKIVRAGDDYAAMLEIEEGLAK